MYRSGTVFRVDPKRAARRFVISSKSAACARGIWRASCTHTWAAKCWEADENTTEIRKRFVQAIARDVRADTWQASSYQHYERDAAEQHRHTDEGERVVGADSVNQLGDQARQAEGGGDADAQLLTVRSEGHA